MAYTIADLFEHAADLHSDRTALICGNQKRTYEALDAESNRLASHLISLGVRPGDHVGVHCRNTIECVAAMLAIYKVRAVVININYRYVDQELAYMLDNSDAVALFSEQRFLPALSRAAAKGADVPRTIVCTDESGGEACGFTTDRYDHALQSGSPDRLDVARSDDDYYIVYTGGTTGMPKGVIWRREDIFRVMGGGIDVNSGVYVSDEWELARRGLQGPRIEGSTDPADDPRRISIRRIPKSIWWWHRRVGTRVRSFAGMGPGGAVQSCGAVDRRRRDRPLIDRKSRAACSRCRELGRRG